MKTLITAIATLLVAALIVTGICFAVNIISGYSAICGTDKYTTILEVKTGPEIPMLGQSIVLKQTSEECSSYRVYIIKTDGDQSQTERQFTENAIELNLDANAAYSIRIEPAEYANNEPENTWKVAATKNIRKIVPYRLTLAEEKPAFIFN